MKTIFLCFILSLGFSNMVFSQSYDDYAKSRYSDLSFEAVAEFHFDELLALSNFLGTPPPELQNALSDLTSLFGSSYLDVEQQSSYIIENGLDCSSIRLCPQDIASMSPADQNDYWTHITYMENNFTFSADELETMQTHVANLMAYSSKELSVSEENVIQYLGLAGMLNYTKLEMFRDMTGFCSFNEYLLVMADPANYPMEFDRGEDQGLGARASIMRLQDIVSCNSSNLRGSFNSSTRNVSNTLNGLSVEVNNDPFSKNINLLVSNKNNKFKTYSATMVDMNGNTINTITNDIVIKSKKQNSYQVSSANLSTGLYFITVVSGNEVITKKVMIFNN